MRHRKILTIAATVCLAIGAAQSLRAQGFPPRTVQTQPLQYSLESMEDLRTQLLSIADSVKQLAAIAPTNAAELEKLAEARTQIQEMSYQQLNVLRRGITPSSAMGTRLQRAQQSIQSYSDSKTFVPRRAMLSDGTAFPNANGSCNSALGIDSAGADVNRIPTLAVLAADVIFFVADGVRELAQDACKETIAGENLSGACAPVDVVWVAAKAIDFGIHFCDDDLTGAVIDASYARLSDLHTDVYSVGTSVDTHIATANTEIDTNVNAKFASLDTHLTNANGEIDGNVNAKVASLDLHLANANTDIDTKIAIANADIDNKIAVLSALTTNLIGSLSGQVTASTNKLVAGQQQIMRLDLTPEGQRQLVSAILTCDGTALNPCPSVLVSCQSSGCSWNVK
jgi:hypothetical protein